jgi:hypothetical protein
VELQITRIVKCCASRIIEQKEINRKFQTKKYLTSNSRFAKAGVSWLNEAFCFYQNFCLVDSEVLRNPPPSPTGQSSAVKIQ